ncbi:Right handed beta helix region [Methanobrevibacter gottschalkii]|uniref:Right handed beta helix region n=1 Tax=Methanobrevibacter gottschalkii TaxID=190974 RepID=A0A1H7FJU5_9EURY|nr:right-handed parallel beta-helix repeat-containing protein [Methanobrevibacter gottschalkii]SEK26259.1 Right handed beta helix region [Methanobrevibacter gottschalkii]
MVKKFNISLLLFLIFISMATVCASDNMEDTLNNNGSILSNPSDESILLSNDDVLTEFTTHEINVEKYSIYFNNNGDLISSKVKSGDTLNFTGDWNEVSSKTFNFNKTLNIVYSGSKPMKNCVFTFYNGATGSSIIGLNIANTEDYNYGIFLNGASNCIVKDCFINNTGMSSYAICIANNANYNNVSNNFFCDYGMNYGGQGTRSTPPVLLSGAHHNYIANNHIECDDANGIYLSYYDGGPLHGGVSNYNLIYNNTVKYNVLPTSWGYGIQIMGGYNKIYSNRIIGAFRGISTSNGAFNEIFNNRIINITGADFNHPVVEVGGEYGIVGSANAIIINNSIENARILPGSGAIYAIDNAIIENNTIDVVSSGYGIQASGSNISIKNNSIITESGAGVFWKGEYFDLVVVGNNITSGNGVGVLVKKESVKKMPGNITIVDNYISTGNKYAIDAIEVNADTSYVIENNTIPKGKGIVATPEGSYDPSKPRYIFKGTTYSITPENYDDYFDVGGTLNSVVKNGDILYFDGNFENKGVIYINSAVKITGKNPNFYNATFRISEGVWIENLTIKNKDSERINAWGILVYNTGGAIISNCNIEVTDPNAAYAIYVVESSDIDVLNNNLTSNGNYLTYTLLAISVYDCNFINNSIHTIGTGIEHVFENSHCVDGNSNCIDGSTCVGGDTVCTSGNTITGNHVLNEVYRTYGILMAYSSGCNISGNKVNATSKLNKTSNTFNSSWGNNYHNNISTNSIVGIDLYFNSHNNTFSNNNIYVKSNDNYIYGMGVLGSNTGHDAPEGKDASNNQFINNNIVLEGDYFVQGLVIGHESKNTTLISNTVNAKSNNFSYGINLEGSQKSIIKDNNLKLTSDIVYGLEVFRSNGNFIKGNNLDIKAKQAYAIALSNAENNIILNNIVMNNVTGEEITYNVCDSLGVGVAGICLKFNSSSNNISGNNITSKKGYAIVIDKLAIKNNLFYNYLNSEMGIGDKAINNTNNNFVKGNYIYILNGLIPEVTINYLGTADIVLNVGVDGVLVKFYICGEEIGNATSSNGVAKLRYKFDDSYTPAGYSIKAIASKKDYLTKEFISYLTIEKGLLNINYNDVTAIPTSKGKFVVVVEDIFGNSVSGITVKFYRLQGRDVFIGKVKTDKNGVATLVAEVPSLGNYKLRADVVENDNFKSNSGKANLIVAYKPSIYQYKTKAVYYGNTIKYTVRVKGIDGKYVAGGKIVTIKVNGKTYRVKTDKYGKAYKSIKLKAGSYKVTAQYGVTKVSSKIKFKPILIAKNIVKKKSKKIKFSVKLVNKHGKILKYKKIIFKIKNKKYSAKTNSHGVAILSIKNLKIGKNTITSFYGGCTISNTITIRR